MCLRFVFLLITQVIRRLRLSQREDAWKTAEILILRHQVAVLQRHQARRPKLTWADRALLATLYGVLPKARLQWLRLLVTPDTIMRWHRDIVRRSAGMLAIATRALPRHVAQADLWCLPVAGESLDGIWCCAALLHVLHDETMAVSGEMRRVLRHDGHLALVTALGQGARLEPVPHAGGTQRWFFYREAAQLNEQLRAARLQVLDMTKEPAARDWLKVLARAI